MKARMKIIEGLREMKKACTLDETKWQNLDDTEFEKLMNEHCGKCIVNDICHLINMYDVNVLIELVKDEHEEPTDLAELNLSVKAYNAVWAAGINTVEQLQTLEDIELLHLIPKSGVRVRREISKKLDRFRED